jgi:hypothetical protein
MGFDDHGLMTKSTRDDDTYGDMEIHIRR